MVIHMDTSRTEILIGKQGVDKLARAGVAVFGLGGVGSYALEALARAGVGRLYLFDYDRVSPSNANRQLLALQSTMGQDKVAVALERVRDINPSAAVYPGTVRLAEENINTTITPDIEYAIDAIDELAPKAALIITLVQKGIPFVSSMGAGSKLNPCGIKVADISKTSHCPLARAMRTRLKKAGITTGVRCVYSEENLNAVIPNEDDDSPKAFTQGSISYVPAIFGLTAAGLIIQDIISS